MILSMIGRRHFLTTAALASSAAALRATIGTKPHVATNVYPWMMFYRRRDQNWNDDVAAGLAQVATSGVNGFEPIGESAADVRQLGPLLEKHKLEMRSLYVNIKLHETAAVEKAIRGVLDIAKEAKAQRTKIIVTNPTPIRWGGLEDKSDAQLKVQSTALNELGIEIRKLGLTLAYHNHDAELRQGAREFHHMLTATDPENVKLCLDSHWIFRGCGNSQVALFDAVAHYHTRIVELHLRQSVGGIWSEAFSMEGDIDYTRLFEQLETWQLKPHLVLEQAVEAKSPNTRSAVEAHQLGLKNLLQAIQ
ncbi:sugar phosphate isomerase/epimerase [bacterium]|nr:sugar phosphate isomerase/epimerase [bacterium]